VVVEVSPRRVFRPTLRTRTSVPPTLPPRIPDPLASEAQGVYHQRYGETPLTPPQNLREHLHVHECDARSPLAKLKPLFPSFIYSPDMTDEDALWQPGSVRGRETEEELVERLGRAAEECLDKSAGATCECFVLGVSSTRLRTRASARELARKCTFPRCKRWVRGTEKDTVSVRRDTGCHTTMRR
jgi:hypothetical protein